MVEPSAELWISAAKLPASRVPFAALVLPMFPPVLLLKFYRFCFLIVVPTSVTSATRTADDGDNHDRQHHHHHHDRQQLIRRRRRLVLLLLPLLLPLPAVFTATLVLRHFTSKAKKTAAIDGLTSLTNLFSASHASAKHKTMVNSTFSVKLFSGLCRRCR